LAALGVTFPITLLGRADAAIEQPCRAATPVHLRAGRGHPVLKGNIIRRMSDRNIKEG
jgi:hypothetical protein